MATPSSSAPPSVTETITSPQHSSSSAAANPAKPFLTSSSTVPTVSRSPVFSAQPLIGKPLNPPPHAPPPHVIYPPGSAVHKGFHVKPSGGIRAVDHLVAVANPVGYLRSSSPMAVMNFAAAMAAASQSRPYVFGGVEHTAAAVAAAAAAAAAAASSHGMRPPPPQGQHQTQHFVVPPPGAARGVSVVSQPKVTSLPLAPEQIDTKERDKRVDDAFVMIHGRKVKLADGGSDSLYTLCRSWIRNGLTQETHPNVGEGVMLLPKPLPTSIVKEMLNKNIDGGGDEEFQEDEGESVELLSSRELLGGHIKRAKRVRARFRRERLLRIERYKQRLSLLLPVPNDVGQVNTLPGSS